MACKKGPRGEVLQPAKGTGRDQVNLLNFCGFSKTRAGHMGEETPLQRLKASCLTPKPHPQEQLGLGT